MKYLVVPQDVQLRDLITRKETGQTYTFWTWIQEIVLMDSRFSVNWKAGRTASKLADALFQQPPGTVVAIEDSDYDLLKEAVEEPQRLHRVSGQVFRGYEQPALLQQIGSFIDAVQAAAARTSKPKDADVLPMEQPATA